MALTFDEARHFLSRTAFGGTPDEIHALMKLDRAAVVTQALSVSTTRAQTPPPAWVNQLPPPPHARKHWTEQDKKAFHQARKEEGHQLKAWWYRELLVTRRPLLERMTLFWHNHFTSSLQKVKWPPYLYQQNVLLRIHALGSFRDLLQAIAKDPAMLLYLDTQTNAQAHPNENFARELFELFTLGEGHYSEQDIKQAARAFTGWHLEKRNGAFRVDPRRHDGGRKEVFGKSGYFEGDDILTLTLEQPETARHLTRKLWREFISDEPDEMEVERLASMFRGQQYRVAPLLHALLLTPQFWAPVHRGKLIKSPVEVIVGTSRLFGVPSDDLSEWPRYGKRLGQDLFDPPNVKGWAGGTRWITTATLLDRTHLLQRLIRGHEVGHPVHAGEEDASMLGPASATTWLTTASIETVQAILLPISPVQPPAADDERRLAIRQTVLDPAYQLK